MLDKILKSSYFVFDNAKHVEIDYKSIDLFLKEINCKDEKYWLSNNPYNLFDLGISSIINMMLLFEAIDYCFWGNPKWSIKTEFGDKDGSDALLYIMIKYVKETRNCDFTKVSFDEFKLLLRGNIEIPFLKERYNTLFEISDIVNRKMNGNFYEYIKDIINDKELFEIIISKFPSFKDERIYKEQHIYFYKLAQLLSSDILHLRKIIENINVDYSHLVGCADYKIPQIMRAFGLIKYDDELTNMIDNKIEIELSSAYEVEIRASMLIVIDYIKTKLDNVNAIDINDYIFMEGRKVSKSMKPYHLCKNINY